MSKELYKNKERDFVVLVDTETRKISNVVSNIKPKNEEDDYYFDLSFEDQYNALKSGHWEAIPITDLPLYISCEYNTEIYDKLMTGKND